MKKINEITSTIGTQKFINHRLKSLKSEDISGNVLDTMYVCADDSESDVTISVTITGNVINGDTFAELEGVELNSSTIPFLIGNNQEIKEKKLTLNKFVNGSEGEVCVLTVYVKGGYKNIPFHLTAKVNKSGVLDFFVTLKFI
jgi:hypothetical protein